MISRKINQKSPEKEFILAKNISGATQSLGAALYFDTAETTDGYAVSAARTGQKWLFAGINAQTLSDDSKGLVQTYGIGSAYVVLSDTAVSLVIGDPLDAVTSQAYLQRFNPADTFTFVAVSSATFTWTGGNPWNFAVAMSAIGSAASLQSTPELIPVFVRAR